MRLSKGYFALLFLIFTFSSVASADPVNQSSNKGAASLNDILSRLGSDLYAYANTADVSTIAQIAAAAAIAGTLGFIAGRRSGHGKLEATLNALPLRVTIEGVVAPMLDKAKQPMTFGSLPGADVMAKINALAQSMFNSGCSHIVAMLPNPSK